MQPMKSYLFNRFNLHDNTLHPNPQLPNFMIANMKMYSTERVINQFREEHK